MQNAAIKESTLSSRQRTVITSRKQRYMRKVEVFLGKKLRMLNRGAVSTITGWRLISFQ
ncbi:hypothetical protein CCP3SC1_70073 [Gammaproteobacteria bacterium]